jgi:hypothetical protein
MALSATVVSTGCARKSGCAAIEQTTKPNTKKNPKASQHLFGKKMRKKM